MMHEFGGAMSQPFLVHDVTVDRLHGQSDQTIIG
jgi:hypothetical protein